MQKKKLLIFHPYLATYRIDLYNALSKVFDVNVLLTGGEKELADLGYDLQTVNRHADFSYRYYSKGFYVGRHLISSIYSTTIKKFKPDIVIAHELGINTLIAILLKRVYSRYALFVTIDDSPNMAIVNHGLLRKLLRRFVISRVNGLLVVNPQVKDFLMHKFSKKSCQYFYLPIIQDEKILADKLHDALPLSKQIFEQSTFRGKKLILYIGRLIEIKDPGLLLETFATLHKNHTDVQLIFIGDGVLKNTLMEYTVAHHLQNDVHFLGRLTGVDLFAWYNIGQLLVLPSKQEAFGAVVNEALVAGCKVIVSDSVGASCLVNEKNGIIFKTNNHYSLYNALSNVLTTVSPLDSVTLKKNNMDKPFSEYIHELINFITL